jgi:hypothetical protein
MTVPQITEASNSRTTNPVVAHVGKWIAGIVAALAAVAVVGLAGAIVFGTAGSPKPVQPRPLDLTNLPALSHYKARDGAELAYRVYPGGDNR